MELLTLLLLYGAFDDKNIPPKVKKKKNWLWLWILLAFISGAIGMLIFSLVTKI